MTTITNGAFVGAGSPRIELSSAGARSEVPEILTTI
jgi:hypothetical protein